MREGTPATIATQIAGAEIGQLDGMVRRIWDLHCRGELTDDEAECLDTAARKARGDGPRAGRPLAAAMTRAHRKPLRRVPPDRAAAIRHRRELGGCGAFPRQVAGAFPTAQQAALTIIAHEVRRTGVCQLHVQEIADRAKVARRTVQNAVREAQRLGLVTVHARRLSPTKNLPNVIRIISAMWRTWLKLGGGAVPRWGANAANCRPQIPVKEKERGCRGQQGAKLRPSLQHRGAG
jgi:hypothetical protein